MKTYSPLKVWFVICQEMLLESEGFFPFYFSGSESKTNKPERTGRVVAEGWEACEAAGPARCAFPPADLRAPSPRFLPLAVSLGTSAHLSLSEHVGFFLSEGLAL